MKKLFLSSALFFVILNGCAAPGPEVVTLANPKYVIEQDFTVSPDKLWRTAKEIFAAYQYRFEIDDKVNGEFLTQWVISSTPEPKSEFEREEAQDKLVRITRHRLHAWIHKTEAGSNLRLQEEYQVRDENLLGVPMSEWKNIKDPANRSLRITESIRAKLNP